MKIYCGVQPSWKKLGTYGKSQRRVRTNVYKLWNFYGTFYGNTKTNRKLRS